MRALFPGTFLLLACGCGPSASEIKSAAWECGWEYDYKSNAFYSCMEHRGISYKACAREDACAREAITAGYARIAQRARSAETK